MWTTKADILLVISKLRTRSLRYWWTLMSGLGAVVLLASILFQSGPAFFIGLGIVFMGIGVWINPEKKNLHGLRGFGRLANPFSTFWNASYWSGLKLFVAGLVMITMGTLLWVSPEIFNGPTCSMVSARPPCLKR
jgi:hypothetical protein